jgi:hypothetical protein
MEITMNIAEFIKNAQNDPALKSRINAEELLKSIDSVKNDFLENQTFDSIATDVFDSLIQLPISKETVGSLCEKLSGYRFVGELHLLHKGKFVRWIRHDKPDKLIRGGIVIDIQFGDLGANILCRLVTGEFLRYRFDKCNTYQKLTEEEIMILTLYEK